MCFKLNQSALQTICLAAKMAEALELPLITREVFVFALYATPGKPVYQYFISKGISESQIEKTRTDILNRYSGLKEYKGVRFVINPIGELRLLVDQNIVDIIERASEIARERYQLDEIGDAQLTEIGDAQLTEAYAELYYDEFMEIMQSYIPSLGEKRASNLIEDSKVIESHNSIIIPRDMSSFLTVLNDNFSKDSKECHICGRDEETKALIRILMKRTKRNVILVGEPGVGKTALIEKFVWSIVTENCPECFKGCIVLSLDVNAIIAGTHYRGTAEERFRQLISFLENNPNCILFVDEVHLLLGAGACKDGDLDLANALKPLLARGDTRVVGATTIAEYNTYFSKDAALKRRFEKIIVNEPRVHEVRDMIQNQVKLLEETHKTTISPEMIDDIIFKASCFHFETKNPDRTLDLIDKAMVCSELAGKSEVTESDIAEVFAVNQKRFEKMSYNQKATTAYHEAGHYVAHIFSSELIEQIMLAVSIVPTDEYLGVNVYEVDPDIYPSQSKEYFVQLIGALLAGRVAEEMYSHTLTAGASSDLRKATQLARNVVVNYGLDSTFSSFGTIINDSQGTMYNEAMISKVNSCIQEILNQSEIFIKKLLTEKKEYLSVLASALIEKGMMSDKEIKQLFIENGLPLSK